MGKKLNYYSTQLEDMMRFMDEYGLVPKNFDIDKAETFTTTRSMLAAVLNKDEDIEYTPSQHESSFKASALRYGMNQAHRTCQTENKILIA